MANASKFDEFKIIEAHIADQFQHSESLLIIHHPDKSQILFSKHDSKPPCIRTKPGRREFPFERTDIWIPNVRKALGLSFEITLLRCIWYKGSKNYQGLFSFQAVLVLDSHGHVTEPPLKTNWQHFSRASAPFPGANIPLQSLISECHEATEPPLRPLYARPGWYAETRKWIELQLRNNGFGDFVQVRQLNCTYRGTVLQIKTCCETFYLKCSPYIVNEASICEKLVNLLPEHVETPVAIDVDKRISLTRDYGDIIAPMMMDVAESEQWELQLAKIHQATSGKEKLLQSTELKLIPIERLPVELEGLFAFVQESRIISADDLQQVVSLYPQFRSDCQEVQTFEIPMTLIHGDIFMSNVYRPSTASGDYGVIDWGEAAISHPFFDMRWCSHPSVYLGSWLKFLSETRTKKRATLTLDRLADCLRLCQKLLPVFAIVKMYLERLEVETPNLAEYRIEFKETVTWLVRNYTTSSR